MKLNKQNIGVEENISIKEKIGFSLGDTASNLVWQTLMIFQLYFYTDIFGLPAAVVGTMFLITKIWDSINDPVMGLIADRTNTKWGKFRPFLLWLALPFALVGVLTFTTPDFSLTGKIIYAYVTYTLMMMVYTAINIPYSSLMGVVSASPSQRASFSQYRFMFAFTGGLLVQALTLPLVNSIGGDNTSVFSAELNTNQIVITEHGVGASKLVLNADIGEEDLLTKNVTVIVYKNDLKNEIDDTTDILYLEEGFGTHTLNPSTYFDETISSKEISVQVVNEAKGFQGVMIVFGIMSIIMFLTTFYTTKERVSPPKEQKTNIKNDFKDLFSNKPWLVLLVIGVISLAYVAIRYGSVMYYFKYYIEDESLVSSFLVSGTIVTIIAISFTEKLCNRFGKKKVVIACQLIAGTFTALFFFVDKSNITMIFALNIIVSLASGPPAPILFAMYTDTASYSEWKNNRRATGLIMSASTMAQKFGLTIGAALAGWILAFYGFKANTVQTTESAFGILLMVSLIPAAGSFLVAGIMSFYPLDNKTMDKIEGELKSRRALTEKQ
ncbi:MFS transporter [Winogradskyella psychrotolerans]|uniref:MFS transporter n=1 Tax=Winogradskyella psychrotolerans TaxID=1344585 RepID=UPI001C06AD8D|nr:MFS transporter [Winogradskyella psychrotolerans]MBU2921565.1 MFS transporter [Winogradskyella psychrotolerans]